MVDYKTNKTKNVANWWQSPLGQAVLEQEKSALQSLSQHFHGYYQLQLGLNPSLLPALSQPNIQTVIAAQADIQACNEALPIKCHSLDLVLLCHALDFSADPHGLLREVDRTLVADGTVILCCFNPWSLWGLKRLFSWQDTAPWQGHFFTKTRIKDWLNLLGFDIIDCKPLLFRPPLTSAKWFKHCQFLERWGRRLWPFWSGSSIVVATKRTIPLTPISKNWRSKQLFSGRSVASPVTRGTSP